MYAQAEKAKETNFPTNKQESRKVANSVAPKKSNGNQSFGFVDNRREAVTQRKLQSLAGNSIFEPIQKMENKTGLSENLKSGIENLSGYSMDDVKMHYISVKPAQLQACTYAKGTDIHFESGQEKHLTHDAWHVVQQKQGMLKPTMQLKGKVNINDDKSPEQEADVMGSKAVQCVNRAEVNAAPKVKIRKTPISEFNSSIIQRAAGDVLTANEQIAFNLLDQYLQGNGPVAAVDAAFAAVTGALGTNLNFVAIYNDVIAGHHRNTLGNRIMGRCAALRTKVTNLRAELASGVLERRDSAANVHAGHALGRHGPDVSDAHLQHRLTTGYAPDGVLSPAPGLSSRFISYQAYLATRQAAVNLANNAVIATRGWLNYYLTAYFNSHINFLQTPAGADRGVAGGVRTAARNTVAAQAALIANPNPNALQVTVVNPVLPNAFANPVPVLAQINAQNLIRNMINCKQTYRIVIDHGHAIGAAFQGTGAPAALMGGGNTYLGTAPAAAPTRTRTTFEVAPGGAQPFPGIPNSAGWTAIQHFPTTEPVGISF